MSARIIDGKAFAATLRARVAVEVAALRAEHGVVPGLAVVLVGEDAASQVYVRSKRKQAVECGFASFEHSFDADFSEEALLALIDALNADPAVHGILVQFPLPPQISEPKVIERIVREKDVDGFHVENQGLLAMGRPGLVPCTPLGSLMLLRDTLGNMTGLNAVVVGRSFNVGRPMAQLLLGANCTVTTVHSRTRDLAEHTRRADILVAAVGRPGMITGEMVKPGATVIDIGINRTAGENGRDVLVGDVHFASALEVAGAITPVPGGVGPMTIACLLSNTVTACCRSLGLPDPKGLAA